jgi:hypothetical protein
LQDDHRRPLMTRTQRSARPPPAVRGSAVTTRVKRRRGGRWALPPLVRGGPGNQGFRPHRNRNAHKEGAAPRAAPRNCGAARTGRTPSYRGRSRTYVSSRSMQIDTWFLHSALFLLTPKFAGGKLAALGPAAARTSFPPGCHSGRGGSRRKPPRPLRSLGCQSVGLRQGDRGSPGVRADPLAKPFLGTRNP